jgi:Protein of unknown function (DUF3455)
MRQVRSLMSCSFLGSIAVLGGCIAGEDASPGRSADQSEEASALGLFQAAALPSFAQTPNIAAAAPGVLGANPVVRALYGTESGFQIYRCDLNAAGQPAWALRSPLAHLSPRGLTASLLRSVSNRYHARSDFGALASDAELTAMGLIDSAGVRTTAPIWQITFDRPRRSFLDPWVSIRRETVAGRVVAQDTVNANDIPWLLIQVRGRAVTPISEGVAGTTSSLADGRANPIAASEYLLRFNTRGGVAPAAARCSEAILGRESQQPYSSDYYFVDVDAPAYVR